MGPETGRANRHHSGAKERLSNSLESKLAASLGIVSRFFDTGKCSGVARLGDWGEGDRPATFLTKTGSRNTPI